MEQNYTGSLVNIGTGEDVTISELAHTVANVLEFKGDIRFDASKPDGTPRKLLCIDRIKNWGWAPKTPLNVGIYLAYQDFLARLK